MSRKPTEASGAGWLLDGFVGILLLILRPLPFRAASTVGAGFGRMASAVGGRKNERARVNLARAGVDAQDLAAACRRGWMAAGRSAFEMLWTFARPADEALRDVRSHGLSDLAEAAREGRGVLLVSAHSGNWEIVPVAAARTGLDVAVVARTLRAPRLESRIEAWRKQGGVKTLVRGAEGSSVSAYRTLSRGGVLGCMMDRASTGRRLIAPFLGGHTFVPEGPLALVQRTGAAIVLGLAKRGPDGGSEIVFRRLRSPATSDLASLAAAIMSAIGDELRDRPETWFWIYRRQHVPASAPATSPEDPAPQPHAAPGR